MAENEDYQLGKFSQQSETSRGVKYKNVYMLTPECWVEGNSPQPIIRGKLVKDWFTNDTTKDLIQECLDQTHLDFVHYKLHAGTRNAFKGTYVHELLYDHFLAWLDAKYAIKISVILKDIHTQANRKIIEDKNCRIQELSDKIDSQSAEIRELLGYAKDTNATLKDVQDDLTETKEEVEIAKSYLTEKSIVSTMNPSVHSRLR